MSAPDALASGRHGAPGPDPVTITVAPRAALAVEDHAIVQGRFDWIIPSALLSRYPNGEMELAAAHVVPRVEFTRGAKSR